MLRVYLETTIPSYLTSRPSRDLVIAARQEMTREWWDTKRHEVDLFISAFVTDEIGKGDTTAVDDRIAVIAGLPELEGNDEVESLAVNMVQKCLLPEKAFTDALHLAVATVHQMDVLLTWNCKHLANPTILLQVNKYLIAQGYVPPLVYTPEELLGEE